MILSGWKEIAAYLRCGVRTVQRWEAAGLPVHRPTPYKRSHVIAHSDELDRWVRNGSTPASERPRLSASLTAARKLSSENRARLAELRERVFQLRNGLAALRERRLRSFPVGNTTSPSEMGELAG